jgi:hypothetical protein
VLKPHLSALAVDSHGMTAAAVGGWSFLTNLICLFIIYKHKFDGLIEILIVNS